ncbi:MAG: flippase-like domain-containing protein [Roseiflexaceae bacterium]|nr:flippase-like domain-containing protein [Roseiflexaceae bacterium]
MLAQLRGKIVIAVLLGLAVVLVISLVSDIKQVGASFASFDRSVLPAILGFTLLNYIGRWLKWDFYLRHMKMGQGVNVADSGLLFTSGMVMAVTPGKVGEVLKSFLLRRMNGTPVTASAPIVLAERLTDGLAMLLLMGLGLTVYPPARPAFIALVALSVAGIIALQFRPLCARILALVGRVPGGAKLAPRLTTVYESMHQLLSFRLLLITTLISLISWFGECVAMYYVLLGLGVEPSWHLLLVATFVFAASTLFGLISFLPGGLGVSEASSTGLLVLLVPGLSFGAATVATLIIRFCTLWFGVTLGALALALLSRRYPLDAQRVANAPPLNTTETR